MIRNTLAVLFVVIIGVVLVLNQLGKQSTAQPVAAVVQPTMNSNVVGAVGPSPTPQASLTDQSSPSPTLAVNKPPAGDSLPVCGVYESQDARMASAETVVGLSGMSDAVVTATVLSSTDGQWATADGNYAPRDPEVGVAPEVYRLVTVRVTSAGKGATDARLSAGSTLNVRVLGGSVGCRTYLSSSDLPFRVGGDVVMFLGSQPVLDGAPRADFDAIDVWPIEDGVVHGRQGQQSPTEVLQESSSKTQ